MIQTPFLFLFFFFRAKRKREPPSILRTRRYHDDDGEESGAGAHHEEAVHKPGGPDDTVGHARGLEGLLEAELLLQDDALHHHGHRVDPGQHHEDGETSVQGQHESVEQTKKTEGEQGRLRVSSC